jgi:CRISPR-associated protein Cst2
MTMHLFGTILTPQAVAHNNRGESEGTVSTLQKVIRNGDLHSTVSSEAIRYALRESWLGDEKLALNRKVSHNGSEWVDKEFKKPEDYIDNDVLGYMHAKKETVSRRGILEISRAISTTPWPGTISAHFASPGSNPAVTKNDPIPYQCEVHDTRYQYTFAFTPEALLKDKRTRTEKTVLAIQNLRRPAGNHARFLFDFAPEAIVLRWTADPAPRMMFCFEQAENGRLDINRLVARTEGDHPDIDPKELVVGTSEKVDGLEKLRERGVKVYPGVKAAFADLLARIANDIKD